MIASLAILTTALYTSGSASGPGKEYAFPAMALVSSADETAFEVMDVLDATGLRRAGRHAGEHRWYSSGDVTWFADLGRRLLGPELASAQRCAFDDPGELDDLTR